MMKKCVLLTMVWLCLLSGGAVARNKEGVAYEIHFDSDTIQTYPLQQQLQETYEQLMQGIQEESSYTVLVHNLSMFESEDVRVRMQQGTLQVWQGGKPVWQRWSRDPGLLLCFLKTAFGLFFSE